MKFEYTVSGKTVKEAYDKAVNLYSSLGEISMEEVISQGKKGFLGIGSTDAQIKVVVDDGKEEKTPKKQPQQEKKTQEQIENKPQIQQNKPQQNKPQQNKPQQNKNVVAQKAETKPAPAPQKAGKEQETVKDEDIKVTAEEKKIAIDFLESFLKSAGFNCEVKGDMTPNADGFVSRNVSIEGEGASMLIGHHGDTLDALQYLTNISLARKSEGDHKEYIKVIVDIENYRAKREETLRVLARKMAEKALKQQRNIHLDPMNPYERRIIHSEIQKISGVSTHSVGYDENRKIVITVDKK